ncbi:hypothetical protein QL285_037532 [Trifolium repens]|nr:hypothetical protein QL285_037532 [Trifolium repens]
MTKSNHVTSSQSSYNIKKILKIKVCSLSEHLASTGEGNTDSNPHLANPGELLAKRTDEFLGFYQEQHESLGEQLASEPRNCALFTGLT